MNPKNAQKTESQEETVLRWTAPEFIQHAKGKVWFGVAGVIIVLLVLYAIRTSSWTMAVAFIVLAGVYYLSHHREPGTVEIKITTIGIRVGRKRIPFNQIKAFWIIYHPPGIKVLKLLTTDTFMAEVTIQLDGQAPGPVREYLLDQIPEYEGKGESLTEILIRLLRL